MGYNNNSIITNFTPTVNTQKILIAFGFKKNNIYNLGLSTANLTKKELALNIKEYLPNTEIISSL